MHPPSNTSSGRRGELPVPDASTGQGPGGVRLSRGRRSSGFEGKCAYGLRKPRKECGGALRGLDSRRPSDAGDGGRQGDAPRRVACRSGLGSAAVGCARLRSCGPDESPYPAHLDF